MVPPIDQKILEGSIDQLEVEEALDQEEVEGAMGGTNDGSVSS